MICTVRVHKDSVVQDEYTAGACAAWMCFLTVIIYACAGFSIPSSGRHHEVCVRAWNPACDVGIFEYLQRHKGNLWNHRKYYKHCTL